MVKKESVECSTCGEDIDESVPCEDCGDPLCEDCAEEGDGLCEDCIASEKTEDGD